MTALPFRIEFSRRAIDDLHRRLDATRWPPMAFPTGWDAGTDDAFLRRLVDYWRREFDWFAVQERLNRYAHVRMRIEDEELHAVLLTGGGASRVPVLLLHGWPGSFLELLSAAELLAQDTEAGPGLDVVVASLPGFGFSEAPRAPGMHPGRIAERMHELMGRLGYARYGVQGGDWGAHVAARLARQHPEAVLGLHLNFPPSGSFLPPPEGLAITTEEIEYRERIARLRADGGGYSHLQGTRPQTLAYALNDSPVGLLAWIVEKLHAWSDHRGEDVWSALPREDVVANVTLYWLTNTALSAARTYYERDREDPPFRPRTPVEVPTAYAHYPAEPWAAPRALLERSFHLVRWTEHARGGHFAALEQPEVFAADVRAFFTSLA